MVPDFAASALARWPGRHECRLLKLVAELHALSPDTCMDPDAWNRCEWDDGSPSFLQALTKSSAWVIEALTEPFYNDADVDRRSSFIGGFPWPCEEFPWLLDHQSKALSPLFQLNLAELNLSAIAEFPPVLIQGWGDQTDFVTRAIPLARIAGRTPDGALMPFHQEHLGYIGNRRGSVGAKLSAGRAHFSLFPYLNRYLIDDGLTERHRAALGAGGGEVEGLLQAIATQLNSITQAAPKFVSGRHFGGQHEPRQSVHVPWEGERVLLEY